MTRTVDQIRRTYLGARPIPPFDAAGPATTPPFIETELPNGLRVLLVQRATAPTVHARVVIPFAGTDPRHAARAAVLTHTLFAGTSRRTRLAIDTEIALLGGGLTAAVTPERLGIAGMSPASGLTALLDVIVDALTDATYPDDEVIQERDLIVQQITQDRANPGVIAREALQRHLYGNHPVTRELPDWADVATIIPAEIRALHHAAVVPRGAVLLLVGDLDPDRALTEVERATCGWTSPAIAEQLPPVPTVTGGDLQVVHLPGAVQSHLRLSAPAVSYTDPRFAALSMATLALGGSFSSRLVEVIREQKGYCYSASSAVEVIQHSAGMSATVNVSLNTATETTADALVALRDELERLVTQPPEGAELDRIRRYAIGSQLTATRSQKHLADRLNGLVNAGLSVDWIITERELLNAVTADDVAAATRDFFTAQFTGVIVGDADALDASLSGVDGVRMP
jgi:predicted Zn-dependent peptidase